MEKKFLVNPFPFTSLVAEYTSWCDAVVAVVDSKAVAAVVGVLGVVYTVD